MIKKFLLLLGTALAVNAGIPNCSALYKGETPAGKAYIGSTLVWQKIVPSLSYEVAWFKCDDTATTKVITDSSINGYNATNITTLASASTVAGKIGQAQAYTTINAFVTDGPKVKETLVGTSWSLCFWAKRASTTIHASWFDIRVYRGTTEQQIICYLNKDNKYLFWYWFVDATPAGIPGIYVNPYFTMNANTWMHFVFIKDGTSYKEYVSNGQYTATVTGYTPLFDSIRHMQIGGESTLNGNTRTIDDVRLYNFALTPTDVAFIFNSGSGTDQPLTR